MKYKAVFALALTAGTLGYDLATQPFDLKELIYKGVFFFLFTFIVTLVIPNRWIVQNKDNR